jgi:hypothetical protein
MWRSVAMGVVLGGVLAGCSYSGPMAVVSGERSHSTDRGSGPSAPPVTHTMGVNARPSPYQIAMALGTANRVTSARLGRYGKDRAVLVGVRAQGVRATVEAAWTTYVTATVVMRDCHLAGDVDCPKLFSETAPNGSALGAGGLTLSNARFPSSLPGVGQAVARRVAAAGLRATSVEVDNVGVAVVIVHAVATDPAEAVHSNADERSVAIPGLAGTLVEISDSHGNLVSINAICNLGQAGTGWTAPRYRVLVPNQMGGARL